MAWLLTYHKYANSVRCSTPVIFIHHKITFSNNLIGKIQGCQRGGGGGQRGKSTRARVSTGPEAERNGNNVWNKQIYTQQKSNYERFERLKMACFEGNCIVLRGSITDQHQRNFCCYRQWRIQNLGGEVMGSKCRKIIKMMGKSKQCYFVSLHFEKGLLLLI